LAVYADEMANHAVNMLQVFFVRDRSWPGWSVVLKKDARSRRINSTEEEHVLGQEGSREDFQVISNMDSRRMHVGDDRGRGDTGTQRCPRRRRRGEDVN